MTKILTSEYFITPNPNETISRLYNIPIHHEVASNHLFKTKHFLEETKKAMRETLIDCLDSKKGTSKFLPYEINGNKIFYGRKNDKRTFDFERIQPEILSKSLQLIIDESSMMFDPQNKKFEKKLIDLIHDPKSELFKDFKEYASTTKISDDKIILNCWNLFVSDKRYSYAINAYFRAFAMTYNNLALKELGIVK